MNICRTLTGIFMNRHLVCQTPDMQMLLEKKNRTCVGLGNKLTQAPVESWNQPVLNFHFINLTNQVADNSQPIKLFTIDLIISWVTSLAFILAQSHVIFCVQNVLCKVAHRLFNF
jgi:hypothetical protein